MATALLAVFILVVSVSLAVAGLVLAQRRIPLELRQSHNVAIGVVYGALQITFGVIVGFSAFLGRSALRELTIKGLGTCQVRSETARPCDRPATAKLQGMYFC